MGDKWGEFKKQKKGQQTFKRFKNKYSDSDDNDIYRFIYLKPIYSITISLVSLSPSLVF